MNSKIINIFSIIVVTFFTFQSNFALGLATKSNIGDFGKGTAAKRIKRAKKINKDLQDLAAAERAFAATAVKEGFRDSFIKFFADDGIGFGPHPEKTKEVLQKTPPDTTPDTTSFVWQPVFGDISLDGDMGYTTGPLLLTDKSEKPRPPGHGMYFSVWQKQSDGSWKVAIDMGVGGLPEAVAPIDSDFTAAKNPNGISKSKAKKSDIGDFNSVDSDFSASIEKLGMVKAYDEWLSDEFRVHRGGTLPILTKDALKKYLESRNRKVSFKQIGGKIANSNDFAFSYGSFQIISPEGVKDDKPDYYYVHVWRRNKVGKWKLVADILNGVKK